MDQIADAVSSGVKRRLRERSVRCCRAGGQSSQLSPAHTAGSRVFGSVLQSTMRSGQGRCAAAPRERRRRPPPSWRQTGVGRAIDDITPAPALSNTWRAPRTQTAAAARRPHRPTPAPPPACAGECRGAACTQSRMQRRCTRGWLANAARAVRCGAAAAKCSAAQRSPAQRCGSAAQRAARLNSISSRSSQGSNRLLCTTSARRSGTFLPRVGCNQVGEGEQQTRRLGRRCGHSSCPACTPGSVLAAQCQFRLS